MEQDTILSLIDTYSQQESIENFLSYEIIEESRRFGISVRRYDLLGQEYDLMIDAIKSDSPELAILKIPTTRIDMITKLQSHFKNVVICSCMVVYERDNNRRGMPEKFTNPGFKFRESNSGDVDILNVMNESIFEGYRNHYTANPRLHEFNVIEAYKEWTLSHVDNPPCRCFLGLIDDDPCAFCALKIDRPRAVIDLNGVVPKCRRRGVYDDLLKSVIMLLIVEGCSHVTIATQVENFIVQKVWISEGFFLAGSYFIVHINVS